MSDLDLDMYLEGAYAFEAQKFYPLIEESLPLSCDDSEVPQQYSETAIETCKVEDWEMDLKDLLEGKSSPSSPAASPVTLDSSKATPFSSTPFSPPSKPAGLDSALHNELVMIPVKDFNVKIQMLKLNKETIEFLKKDRKRMRNKEAAIRCRNQKELKINSLEKRVALLSEENSAQAKKIQLLEKKLKEMEAATKAR